MLRIRWVATSQAVLPETKRETKLKDRARNCNNNDRCFFNGIKQVGLQKSREEISQKIITYQVLEVPNPVTTSVKLYRRYKLIFIHIFSLFSLFFRFFPPFFRLIFVSLRFFHYIFAYFTFVFASDFWCFASK